MGPVLSAHSRPLAIFLDRAAPLRTAPLSRSRVEDEEHAAPAHTLEPSYAVTVRRQTAFPSNENTPAWHGYGHSPSKQRLGDVSSQGVRQQLLQLLPQQPLFFLHAFVESGREQLLHLASRQWKQTVEISFSGVIHESSHSRLRYLLPVPEESLRCALGLDVFAVLEPADLPVCLGPFGKTMTSSVAGSIGTHTSTT